jgi:hypothetical protein
MRNLSNLNIHLHNRQLLKLLVVLGAAVVTMEVFKVQNHVVMTVVILFNSRAVV